MAEKLAPALGQPVVVDNRPGAGGVIGTEAASKAPPDGYTLLMGSSGPITISPSVQKVSYDPQRDFAPVTLVQTGQYVLVVNPSLKVNTAKELIALLTANPGKAFIRPTNTVVAGVAFGQPYQSPFSSR